MEVLSDADTELVIKPDSLVGPGAGSGVAISYTWL